MISPINILSYQQPLLGSLIKDWILFHIENGTEYSTIARRMKKYMSISDEQYYNVCLRPKSTASGEATRYHPIVIKENKTDLL